MGNVSKPLIALLVGTVAFFALWTVALKGGASGGASSKSLGTYQSAIDAFGENGLMDIIGAVGYYGLVSMTLNIFEVEDPE